MRKWWDRPVRSWVVWLPSSCSFVVQDSTLVFWKPFISISSASKSDWTWLKTGNSGESITLWNIFCFFLNWTELFVKLKWILFCLPEEKIRTRFCDFPGGTVFFIVSVMSTKNTLNEYILFLLLLACTACFVFGDVFFRVFALLCSVLESFVQLSNFKPSHFITRY